MCSSITDAKWFSCLNIDHKVAMCISSACVGPDWLIVSVIELGNTLIKKLTPFWFPKSKYSFSHILCGFHGKFSDIFLTKGSIMHPFVCPGIHSQSQCYYQYIYTPSDQWYHASSVQKIQFVNASPLGPLLVHSCITLQFMVVYLRVLTVTRC